MEKAKAIITFIVCGALEGLFIDTLLKLTPDSSGKYIIEVSLLIAGIVVTAYFAFRLLSGDKRED